MIAQNPQSFWKNNLCHSWFVYTISLWSFMLKKNFTQLQEKLVQYMSLKFVLKQLQVKKCWWWSQWSPPHKMMAQNLQSFWKTIYVVRDLSVQFHFGVLWKKKIFWQLHEKLIQCMFLKIVLKQLWHKKMLKFLNIVEKLHYLSIFFLV